MAESLRTLFRDLSLEKPVLFPDDAEYDERQNSYWSAYSKAQPGGIVRPTSAQEVSAIVKALVRSKQKFAVRSGGHAQWYGANNIKDGVSIDLCCMAWTKLAKSQSVVEIGPGTQWKDVYAALEQHGWMVAGGRNGKVGAGGLLLGGGITFFTGSRGFACDDILAYQIVLADGRILTVDDATYSDLFLTLKGGAGNFGIVTNFTMRAFPSGSVWAGLRIFPQRYTEEALQALQRFTRNMSHDVHSNLLVFLGHMDDIYPMAAMVQVEGVEKAPAYADFLAMPAVKDTTKLTTIRTVVTQYEPVPSGYYNSFFTITVKNDLRIFRKASEIHDQVVQQLKEVDPEKQFLTECLFQPLPQLFGQRSKEVSGNIMGVSDQPANGVLFVAIVVVKTAEHAAEAYPILKRWGHAVRDYAQTIDGGLLPWIYANYADSSQDPLGSYGAENVRRIKEAAAKYDPDQVFQKLCPGGFKITRVQL